MRNRLNLLRMAASFAVWLLPFSWLSGQSAARALSLGGAYTALARGVHAADWNPANLGLPDNPGFSMTFLAGGAHAGNNSFSWGDYLRYNGEALSAADITDILNRIPDDGLDIAAGGQIRMLSFSVRRFAVTLGADAGGWARTDKSLFDLAFRGNALNSTIDLSDSDGRGMGYAILGVAYGQPVDVDFGEVFTVGGRVSLLYGGVQTELQQAGMRVTTHAFGFDVDGTYAARVAQGGVGWDLGLGAAAVMNERLTLSLGLSHLLGRIPWNREVRETAGYVRGDSVAVYDFSHEEEGTVADSTWERDGSAFSSGLPVVMRLGAVYRDGRTLLTADYEQGFTQGALTGTTPRLSLGTEWQGVAWLPLRAGVALGGRIGWGTSFGLGLRFGAFAWDFAVLNRGFITQGSSKGMVLAMECGLHL